MVSPFGPTPFTPTISPFSFLMTFLMFIFTKISAPHCSASFANHLYVFLTSNTAALGMVSLIVTSLLGEQNEKFLIGLKQSSGIPNSLIF